MIEFHIRRRGGDIVCGTPTYDATEVEVLCPHEKMCPACLANSAANEFEARLPSGNVWVMRQQANQPVMLNRCGAGLTR